ncbi:MAG: hypothetical protein B6U94_05050 [Thermofilum sp. ex4484_79]|nr:MAG: hypothetical protein B6U94_05050 [Thermofilum sp. ex4484_79]
MRKININFLKVASKLKSFKNKILISIKKALTRGIRLYYQPLQVFSEIKKEPDILSPLTLLLIALVIHTFLLVLLVDKITIIYPDSKRKPLIHLFNISSLFMLKTASIISLWFLSFVFFWFALYFMGVPIEGFTIFSASGYFLGSPFLIYIISAILYEITNLTTPSIYLIHNNQLSLETFVATTIMLKFHFAQKMFKIPLYILSQMFFWYGTLWTVYLSVCLLKSMGGVSWKKSFIGGLIVMMIIYIVEAAFHTMGLL